MTQAVQPISYASAHAGNCPLCHRRPVVGKMIYGHRVCKKCYYAFANRRQLGFLLDELIFIIPAVGYSFGISFALTAIGLKPGWQYAVLFQLVFIPLYCLFLMKDGFGGQSPGKMAADILVLDEASGKPIRFVQSFKRNSILLFTQIPFIGRLAGLVVVITIAVQVARGYRWGDKVGHTKAIWRKYAQSPVFGGKALVCEHCGYDLQGNTSGICPECGKPISESNAAKLAMAMPTSDPIVQG